MSRVPTPFHTTDTNKKEQKHDSQVIGHALSALVNLMFRSDANRGLAEECGATQPTITIMDAVDDEGALVQVQRVKVERMAAMREWRSRERERKEGRAELGKRQHRSRGEGVEMAKGEGYGHVVNRRRPELSCGIPVSPTCRRNLEQFTAGIPPISLSLAPQHSRPGCCRCVHTSLSRSFSIPCQNVRYVPAAAFPLLAVLAVEVKACLALANMAYVNQFAALRLLEAGADKAACDLIRDSDKTRHSDVLEAVRFFYYWFS